MGRDYSYLKVSRWAVNRRFSRYLNNNTLSFIWCVAFTSRSSCYTIIDIVLMILRAILMLTGIIEFQSAQNYR